VPQCLPSVRPLFVPVLTSRVGSLFLIAWWSAAKLAVLTDSSGRGRAGAAAALGANLPNRDSSAGQASTARTVGCFLW